MARTVIDLDEEIVEQATRVYGVKGRCLVDKSVLARRGKPAVRARLDALDRDGLLAVCAPTEYEVLNSAREMPGAVRLRKLLRGFDYLACDDEESEWALEIQALALNAGFRRALSLADVLIAAIAERHRVTVLHYDGDFDMTASVSGLQVEWVVSRVLPTESETRIGVR